MGYCNSSSYIQWQMNKILHLFCTFAQEYVNDIIIFSKTLNEHVHHLHQVFSLFQDLSISLKSKKFYLDYSTVTLLEQWVDVLNLFTSEKKIRALTDLQFPTILKILEIYLDLMGWLHFYILYYVQIITSLQICKIALLKASSAKKNTQKQHISCVFINKLSPDKVHTFKTLQNLFRTFIFLIHFDSSHQLYIDMNVFKQYDFDAVVYHVEEDLKEVVKFLHHKIQFILFLSKLLTPTEWNYWSIKMEMTELVWVMWKTRHLIKSVSSKLMIIVFTDHSATIFIAQQTHLITTISTDKLNLQLVQISQYLSQFNLNVWHCSGKIHLVSDALSWLLDNMTDKIKKGSTDTLNDIEFYHIILIKLADNFKQCLQNTYKKDNQWKYILDMIQFRELGTVNEDLLKQSAELHFTYWNDLIYYVNNIDGCKHLCISVCLKKKIFELAHNQQHHSGFHCTYDQIFSSLFLQHFIRWLKRYIFHCSECQVNQMKHHSLYGLLQPILMFSISFHIIIMNFVLVLLSADSEWFNNLFTVTDKFMKWILLLSSKSIYTAVNWVNVLLSGLINHDWGILHQIINDQNQKFFLSFWHVIFEHLSTKLLTSTAYHSQTDSQSEQTNQIIKIALHYFLTSNSDKVFTTVLSYLQDYLNNSQNSSISYVSGPHIRALEGLCPNNRLWFWHWTESAQVLALRNSLI